MVMMISPNGSPNGGSNSGSNGGSNSRDPTAVLTAVLMVVLLTRYLSTKHQQNYILVGVELRSGLRRGTDAEFFYCIFKHIELEFCMYATACSDEWGR